MHIISIKKEGEILQVCLLEKKWTKLTIVYSEMISLSPKGKEEKTAPFKKLEKFLGSNCVYLMSISAIEQIEKVAEFPNLSWAKIDPMTPLQLETLFPYDKSSFFIFEDKKEILGVKKKTFRLVPKELLIEKVKEWNSNGIELDACVWDQEGLKFWIAKKNRSKQALYIHGNFHDTHLLLVEQNTIKAHHVLNLGYEALIHEAGPLHEREYIKRLIYLMKLQQLDIIEEKILSGLLIDCEEIKEVFAGCRWIDADRDEARLAQVIGNATWYAKNRGWSLLPETIEQPKKTKVEHKRFKQMLALLAAGVLALGGAVAGLESIAKEKMAQALDAGQLFHRHSLQQARKIIDQFPDQEPAAQTLIDLHQQPLALEKLLAALEKPFLEHRCKLKGMEFSVVKHPTLKVPNTAIVSKVILTVAGERQEVEKLFEAVKKLPIIHKKKQNTIEQKKDEFTCEFFIS